MDLQVKDLILYEVKEGFGSISYLEIIKARIIDGYVPSGYITPNLFISKDFKITPVKITPVFSKFKREYNLLKVWRLDENDNWIRIYPEPEKEEKGKEC